MFGLRQGRHSRKRCPRSIHRDIWHCNASVGELRLPTLYGAPSCTARIAYVQSAFGLRQGHHSQKTAPSLSPQMHLALQCIGCEVASSNFVWGAKLHRPHRMCSICVWAKGGAPFSKTVPSPCPQTHLMMCVCRLGGGHIPPMCTVQGAALHSSLAGFASG